MFSKKPSAKKSMTTLVLSLVAGASAMSIPAFAQEETPVYKNEASVQAFGSFVDTTRSNGINQSATNSGGVLASYRFFFTPRQGVEIELRLRPQHSELWARKNGPIGVRTYSHEVSGDYVLRFPLRHWSPFLLAGAGGLVFDPKDFAGASVQVRPAFVYGGGADFNLSKRVFVRVECRGLFYNSPTYDFPGLSGLDRISHRAEPSVGFGFRF